MIVFVSRESCAFAEVTTSHAVPVQMRRFPGDTLLRVVYDWVDTLITDAPFAYEVSSPTSTLKLTRDSCGHMTLKELGFVPNIALIVRRV